MYRDTHNFKGYMQDFELLNRVSKLNFSVPLPKDVNTVEKALAYSRRVSGEDLENLRSAIKDRYSGHLRNRQQNPHDLVFFIQSSANIINQAKKNTQDMIDLYGMKIENVENYPVHAYTDLLRQIVLQESDEEKIQDFKKLAEYRIGLQNIANKKFYAEDSNLNSYQKFKSGERADNYYFQQIDDLDKLIQDAKKDVEDSKKPRQMTIDFFLDDSY